MLTIEQIMDRLDDENLMVTVTRRCWYGAETEWAVELESRSDSNSGVKLEVTKTTRTFAESLRQAWALYSATASSGLPALAAPVEV